MPLPRFLEPFLPSFDISQMDLRNPYDKKLVIEAVLNQGAMKEVRWLFKTYSKGEIKNVLRNPSRGCWDERALNYWTRIFKIQLPKIIFDVAVFSLEPRPRLLTKYFNYLKRMKMAPRETLKAWRQIEKLEKVGAR